MDLQPSKNSGGVAGLATVPQQQAQSQMPDQTYAMGPPQVGFSFRVEPPTICRCVGVYSDVYILLSGAMLDAILTCWDQPLGFAPLQPFGSLSMAGICATW